tara:strand:+ start:378 stop:1217 length:840 start_codon:yes stop_codon:yes gene_type:complete
MKIVIAGIRGYLGFKSKIFFQEKGYQVYDYKRKLPENIDVILNMSGPPQAYCEKYPNKSKHYRAKLNEKLIKIANKKKAKFFFYISTMHIYKDAKILKTSSKIYPNNAYSVSHINGEEKILNSIKNYKNISFKILRLTNCIGSPNKKKCNSWKLLINDICKQSVIKKRIKLYSKKNNHRDFITIDYFLNSLLFLIKNKNKNSILNISSGKSVSIYKMAKIVQSRFYNLFKRKLKIIHNINFSSDNTRVVVPTLNKKFKNNLKKHIDQTLLFAKKNFKNI